MLYGIQIIGMIRIEKIIKCVGYIMADSSGYVDCVSAGKLENLKYPNYIFFNSKNSIFNNSKVAYPYWK